MFAKALGILLFFAPAAAVLLIAPGRLRRPLPLVAAYAVAGGLTAYPLLRYFQVTATVRVAVSKSDASLLERLAAEPARSARPGCGPTGRRSSSRWPCSRSGAPAVPCARARSPSSRS